MSSSTILHNISPDELFQKIKELISEELESKLKSDSPVEYLTRSEVAKKLRSSKQTIDRLTAAGKLKKYRLGRHILYRANEVELALTEIELIKYKRQ
jgi:excisionase family DNA binding protein